MSLVPARRELDDILSQTTQTPPHQTPAWHQLHERLNTLTYMTPPRKTPWAWGMAQVMCHYHRGEVHDCRQHIAAWAEYLTWSALLHPALQHIVCTTREIAHDLWVPALLPLLQNLAHEDRPKAHITVSHWLTRLGHPHLKRRWLDALMHSAHVNAETLTILHQNEKNRSI